jgi:hypothetical protein
MPQMARRVGLGCLVGSVEVGDDEDVDDGACLLVVVAVLRVSRFGGEGEAGEAS